MNRSQFIKGYAELLIYFRDHLDSDISISYISPNGFNLGKWLDSVRKLWIDGYLTSKQVAMLQKVGISQKSELQTWETLYFYAKEYYMKHESVDIPRSYRTVDGIMLGAWIERQKKELFMLSKRQRDKLKKIGIGNKE